mmetsp:Transcript_29587/g.49749  ORF Transcript_29587/g.49749 Transcript_29587/m.49749 type:complete len:132 (+) Transcript_29587:744-1139(+)
MRSLPQQVCLFYTQCHFAVHLPWMSWFISNSTPCAVLLPFDELVYFLFAASPYSMSWSYSIHNPIRRSLAFDELVYSECSLCLLQAQPHLLPIPFDDCITSGRASFAGLHGLQYSVLPVCQKHTLAYAFTL